MGFREPTMPDPIDLAQLDLDDSFEIPPLLLQHPDIELRRYRDGEMLVREGETSQDLFIVLKGSLVVECVGASPEGPPMPLAHLECDPSHPCIIGEMAYFGAQRRVATVRSVGGSLALRLQPRHVDAILAGFPRLTQILCQQFTRRLQETNAALQELQRRFDLAPERRMAQAGERLFAAGDAPTTLFQLAVGTIQLEQKGKIKNVEPQNLMEGFLEPEAFLRNHPYQASATVGSIAFLAVIDQAHKEAFVRCYPQLVLSLLEARSSMEGSSRNP